MIEFLRNYHGELWQYTLEHLFLVVVSIVIAVAIGVPLGILCTRTGWNPLILGIANIFQTIPSLALFGFLIPIPVVGGIGARSAIFALVLYSLLPIIRNTYTGITQIDPAIKEAGKGMGMTQNQLLWKVEIPLSLNVILAGIRVATVIAIGVATIAAIIGAGGLGQFIFRGVAVLDTSLILAGAVPAALMALLADFGLGLLEKMLTPPGWKKA